MNDYKVVIRYDGGSGQTKHAYIELAAEDERDARLQLAKMGVASEAVYRCEWHRVSPSCGMPDLDFTDVQTVSITEMDYSPEGSPSPPLPVMVADYPPVSLSERVATAIKARRMRKKIKSECAASPAFEVRYGDEKGLM